MVNVNIHLLTFTSLESTDISSTDPHKMWSKDIQYARGICKLKLPITYPCQSDRNSSRWFVTNEHHWSAERAGSARSLSIIFKEFWQLREVSDY